MPGKLNRRESLFAMMGWLALGGNALAASTKNAQSSLLIPQGALVRWRTVPGASVRVDNKFVRVSPDGQYVFGVAWNRKKSVKISIEADGCSPTERTLQIQPRVYHEERIDQLPGKFVTPQDRQALAKVNAENQLIRRARAHNSNLPWFAQEFSLPVDGAVTDYFGSQRTLNGLERRPHFGIDIAAAEGTEVLTPQAGIVRLAEHDLYFSGGTIVIDHGYGVTTSYLHLRQLELSAGQTVSKGQKLGEVGMTGRATGPHLCWRLNWFQERLDPLYIAQPNNLRNDQVPPNVEEPSDQASSADIKSENGRCPRQDLFL